MTLIDREGDAKTFVVPDTKAKTLQSIARPVVDGTATIITDSHPAYDRIRRYFRGHEVIDHSKSYVRGLIHTNFAESYHSLLKRGVIGTFHHVSEKHLPRYLSEFEFRWNSRKTTDSARTASAIAATGGKRLTYKPLKATPKGTMEQLFPEGPDPL
jgi:hypothetical protein